jgi:uncharacterized membrane protein YhhN
MRRFILTGAPGAGKTSILRALAAGGYAVVAEAATDVMSARLALGEDEPWAGPMFIERIAALQRQRRNAPVRPGVTAPPPGPGVMGWGSRVGRCRVARGARGVFVVLAAADTLLAGAGRDRERWLTKPLLMPVLMAGSDRGSRRALALGGAGDMALLGTGDVAFTTGLACFLAGHAAWIHALRQRPGGGRLRSQPVLAVPYLAAFGTLNAYLWPRTGKDRLPVLAYSTALLAMSLAALDSGSGRTAAGGALFLLSDTLLALEKFAGVQLPAHEGLVMATYTSAQALLASPPPA